MLNLTLDDGSEVTLSIRALRVKEFPAAFERWQAEDEPGLVALGVEGPVKPDALSQASYEVAFGEFMRCNSAFFAWCGRRWAKAELVAGAPLSQMRT
jgi:hypothetical protein